MPYWMQITLTFCLWALTVLILLRKWFLYGRQARAGLYPPEAVTSHITADLVALGVGIGAALLVRYLLEAQPWIVPRGPAGQVLVLTALVPGIGFSILLSRLYQRFCDAKVRAFLLADPAGGANGKGNVQ